MTSVSKAGVEDRVKALYYIMQSAEVRHDLLSDGRGAAVACLWPSASFLAEITCLYCRTGLAVAKV